MGETRKSKSCLVQFNLEATVNIFQSDTLFEKCDICFCCRNHNFFKIDKLIMTAVCPDEGKKK